jgi:hypothetical protein
MSRFFGFIDILVVAAVMLMKSFGSVLAIEFMAFTRDSEQRNNRDEQEEKFHGVLPTGQVWKCNFNLPGFQAMGAGQIFSRSRKFRLSGYFFVAMYMCKHILTP